MPKCNPPDSFAVNRPNKWSKWKQRLVRFQTKLHEEDDVIQTSSLIYAMGTEAEGIFMSLGLADGDEKEFKNVLESFSEYFVSERNMIHKRAKFYVRYQRKG